MEISSILKEALSSKVAANKTKKRVRLEENTQESKSNVCPKLVRCKPHKEPVITVTYSSSVPTLPKEDTKKNCNDVLQKWKLNLILETQVVAGPLDLSHVDFNCLKDISSMSLSFNVYHPTGDECEAFQREWKKSEDFIIPSTTNNVHNDESPFSEG
ncbi:hypothetical protein PVK06_047694 [Gossypium arboreum]|uniref:Uncharacterized protein n=1 Tax=Gossypium arboreum TaxID=29729 RepID=A0ABR0ME45_GOSAR|nr:hypothetical protein PVK06_047694 [Gossypium arboreum]